MTTNISRLRRGAMGALAAGATGWLLACAGTASSGPMTPEHPATIRDGDMTATGVTVALRITLDEPDDATHVHLHAVTYGLDGNETTTDLGQYVGTVLHETSNADELIRITIEHAGTRRSIRLRAHDGVLDAEELPAAGAADTSPALIERIEVPEGATVRPSDTPIEQPR